MIKYMTPRGQILFLMLEIAFYIAVTVVKAKKHESEVKLFVMLSNLDCCSTENDPVKNNAAQHQTISSSLFHTAESLMKVKHSGFWMLHRLPCSSTFLCTQVFCWCRSSFASRQTFCTCSKGFSVPVLL